MFLVIDTNVLFSFFHPRSGVMGCFKSLKDRDVTLLVPQGMFDELLKIMPKILKYCNLSRSEFSVMLALLLKSVEIIPKVEYEQFMSEAKKTSPHLKDAPLFALSLAFNKAPIWSREPGLKRQKVVRVLSDEEVKEYFGLSEA